MQNGNGQAVRFLGIFLTLFFQFISTSLKKYYMTQSSQSIKTGKVTFAFMDYS